MKKCPHCGKEVDKENKHPNAEVSHMACALKVTREAAKRRYRCPLCHGEYDALIPNRCPLCKKAVSGTRV